LRRAITIVGQPKYTMSLAKQPQRLDRRGRGSGLGSRVQQSSRLAACKSPSTGIVHGQGSVEIPQALGKQLFQHCRATQMQLRPLLVIYRVVDRRLDRIACLNT